MLIKHFGDRMKIIEAIVIAAAETFNIAPEMLQLLIEHFGNQVKISGAVIKVAVGKFYRASETLNVLIAWFSDQIEMNDFVLKAHCILGKALRLAFAAFEAKMEVL
ncbi:Hypothetical protein D9617_82g010590 [Elsinoe fawcettii]|nr:Hypothetical protein D9617_82g010590 [Elsinoe fawcettii]